MCYFAMDLGWKRVPMLLILLIFWKHAFGQKGWSSHGVPPYQKWHDHKIALPWGAQSSVLEAPVTGSIPFEEVASNVLAGKSLNAGSSRSPISRQDVKGGISSSYVSMSDTQSAPTSVSASWALPQNQLSLYRNTQLHGSFSPSVQDIASQSGLQLGETSSPLSALSSSSTGSSGSSLSDSTYTSHGSSGPQLAGSSSQLVSTNGLSGLLPQSQSTASQNILGSSVYTKLAASPPTVSQSPSGQSSYSQYTSGFQRRFGTKLAASHQYVPALKQSSYGSSFQPQDTTSQYAPTFSWGTKVPVSSQYYPATLSGSSQSLSQSSQKWQPSIYRTKVFQPSSTAVLQGFQTSGALQSISQYPSRFVSLSSVSADGSSLQPQGTSSQYAYSQVAPSGFSLSMSQPSQLKPSTSRWSQGFQASGTVASQSSSPSQGSKSPSRLSTLTSAASPSQSFSNVYTSSSLRRAGAPLLGSSRYVPMKTGSTSTDGSSLQLQGTSSQYAPAFVAKVPPYKPAAQSGSASLSQPSQWQASNSLWSQGFQASGTVASQSSSPSQGSKSTSRFSTLTSAASPGDIFSTHDGSGRYRGLFSQSQSASSQSAPAALDAKVPVYSQAAPSGFSLSMSQPSQLKSSTSRWSQGFQASGTVASQGFQTYGTAKSQSNSPSQGSKSPSRFFTSAASPGQSFSNVYTSSSIRRVGAPLLGSSRYVPMQTGSTSTDGSSLQLQGISSQYAPAFVAKVPLYKPAAPSGSASLRQPSQWQPSTSRWSQGFQASGIGASQGFQTYGTVTSQSNSPSQGSKSPSRFSTLTSAESPGQSFSNVYTSSSLSRAGAQLAGSSRYVPVQTGSTSTDGSSLQLQGTSSQYATAALDAKVPVYSQAAPSGFSLSTSQPSQWQPSTYKWSQGFQASGTVASQSSSPSQGSKSPGMLSTLTSAASPSQSFSNVYTSSSIRRAGAPLLVSSHYVPMQTGSTSTDGSSLQLQGTSSQYAPAFVAKVPPYKLAAPSGSASLSQPSQWQPSTSRWSQGFLASGTVESQSSSPSQGSKSTSRFSTLTSAASPGNFFSTQDGSGRYSGLSSESQSASSQYNPGSPAYAKRGFSFLDSSRQSTSDPSSSPQFSSGSSFMAALSRPVAQSSISNSWTSSLSTVQLRPSMLSSEAASDSIRRQMPPGLFGSVQHPTDSTTYGQKPSQSSSISGRYHSSVKG